jgi:hypothetical protein
MNNDEVYLSKMLRGENMGISLYEKYLRKLPEGKYKREAESFRKEHIRHKARLENIMQIHNFEISQEIGIQGKMTELFTAAKLVFKNSQQSIMREIYKGEEMGMRYTKKYLNEFSGSIKPDIEKIINEEKGRLDKINKIIQKI